MGIEWLLTTVWAGWTISPPKLVLAFYYPWYGNPDLSGRWIHWSGVDLKKREIASSTHYPLLGPYDSHDPKVCGQHVKWARESGIDGFIVSWWGQGDFSDEAMKPILEAAQKGGLKVTIYYETVPKGERERAADDLLYILNRYADHPAWLRVDGKSVIFIYGRAIGQIGLEGWREVTRSLRERFGDGFVLVGDRISAEAAEVFGGIHTYNPCAALRGKDLDEVRGWARDNYPEWVRIAREKGAISCVTVIPGYDDTKIRKPGIRVDRFDGRLYEALWEEAIKADPDWILITSWNEWHEGSEIEPSVEHGDLYLKLTRRLAERFKAGR